MEVFEPQPTLINLRYLNKQKVQLDFLFWFLLLELIRLILLREQQIFRLLYEPHRSH